MRWVGAWRQIMQAIAAAEVNQQRKLLNVRSHALYL